MPAEIARGAVNSFDLVRFAVEGWRSEFKSVGHAAKRNLRFGFYA
jgi:hypothetical protein